MKSRRRSTKENSNEGKMEQKTNPRKSNSFKILQEEGEDEDQIMEYQQERERHKLQ